MRLRRLVSALLVVLALGGCSRGRVSIEAVAPGAITPPVVLTGPPTTRTAPLVLPAGCSSRAVACVSTGLHVAWLQEGGRPTYGPVPVAIGTPGSPTPHGTFHVAWKDREHTSSTYGTNMPYSVFFAAGGVAFHQGPLGEGSHGCVHLSGAAAAVFFAALGRGDRVEVF
jgi:hypothetical protein